MIIKWWQGELWFGSDILWEVSCVLGGLLKCDWMGHCIHQGIHLSVWSRLNVPSGGKACLEVVPGCKLEGFDLIPGSPLLSLLPGCHESSSSPPSPSASHHAISALETDHHELNPWEPWANLNFSFFILRMSDVIFQRGRNWPLQVTSNPQPLLCDIMLSLGYIKVHNNDLRWLSKLFLNVTRVITWGSFYTSDLIWVCFLRVPGLGLCPHCASVRIWCGTLKSRF